MQFLHSNKLGKAKFYVREHMLCIQIYIISHTMCKSHSYGTHTAREMIHQIITANCRGLSLSTIVNPLPKRPKNVDLRLDHNSEEIFYWLILAIFTTYIQQNPLFPCFKFWHICHKLKYVSGTNSLKGIYAIKICNAVLHAKHHFRKTGLKLH